MTSARPERIRVVHVIGALPVGGVERNLLRVLPMLDRDRFELSVVTLRERGELADDMEAQGVPVTFKYMRTRYDPASLWRLARHLRTIGAQIVHCHMRRANTSGRIAAMLARVPVRLAHERDLGLGKRRRHYLVDRLLARFNGPVLCVTQAVLEYNHARSGIPRGRFLVQYNGIDVAELSPPCTPAEAKRSLDLPMDRPVIGCIGRLHRIKRIPLLLDAFAELRHTPPPMLALVGEGKEAPALRDRVRALGIKDRVRFLPWQRDLARVYRAFDVTALTSQSEGIANVQLESLAAGVPLVSTRVGIAAEALEEGAHYLAVDPIAAAVRDGLARALQPDTRGRLVSAGRRAVQAFDLSVQRDHLAALYERLIAEASDR